MRLWLLFCACNQAALPPNSDGSVPDLRSGSEFCSGQARVELNGMRADSPFVRAAPVFLNCCEAAEFSVVSMQIAEPLVFAWRAQVGFAEPPITIDLAKPPDGWELMLASGCSTLQAGCAPNDQLREGFSGTLTIARTTMPAFAYEMSVCMTALAPAAHPVIKSARLWSPTIKAE